MATFKAVCSILAWVEILGLALTLGNNLLRLWLLKEQNRQPAKRRRS